MLAAETKADSGSTRVESWEGANILWNEIVQPIQPFLKAVVEGLESQVDEFDPDIGGYVRYALTNQGKQLRPSLIALAGGATGGIHDGHVQVAVIVEMVHLATLVHDDVMDDASMRRRQPTLAANWGSHLSVLVGDCLFARALELAARFPTPAICRAVARAANRVCSGEILQNQRQGEFELSRSEYFRILELKTAELFALSCVLGSNLNDPNAKADGIWRRFGLHLGTAYQVYDDCVDLFGSETKAGKSLGSDLAGGKLTLPMLFLLERASEQEKGQIRQMVADWDSNQMPELRALLDRHSALRASQEVVSDLLGAARHELESLPDSSNRIGLGRLLDFLARLMDSVGLDRGR